MALLGKFHRKSSQNLRAVFSEGIWWFESLSVIGKEGVLGVKTCLKMLTRTVKAVPLLPTQNYRENLIYFSLKCKSPRLEFSLTFAGFMRRTRAFCVGLSFGIFFFLKQEREKEFSRLVPLAAS